MIVNILYLLVFICVMCIVCMSLVAFAFADLNPSEETNIKKQNLAACAMPYDVEKSSI